MPKTEIKKVHQKKREIAVKTAIATPLKTPAFTRDLLSKEEFRERLGLGSTRLVDQLIQKRKIPVIRLGHRTVRIPWSRACEALARLEVRAVGQ